MTAFRRLLKSAFAPAPKTIRRPARLGMESLEAREVPAAVANLLGTTLEITGTAEADQILIRQTASRIYVQDAANGVDLGSWRGSTVGRVVVNGLGGDDLIDLRHDAANPLRLPATLNGGDGRDTIHGGAWADVIDGGNDIDRLYGYDGNDTIYGQSGSDYLYGGAGSDYLNGGRQNDTIEGGGGNDRLLGGSGNDRLQAGDDGSFLYGEGDDDVLIGGIAFDQLYGGSGNDALIGGRGEDWNFGGDGFDRYLVDAAAGSMTGDLVQMTGTDDARIHFRDGSAFTNKLGTYTAKQWTTADILRVDAVLDVLHDAANNTRLLKLPLDEIVFLRQGGTARGFNGGDGGIYMTDAPLQFGDTSAGDTNLRGYVLHEIGHNWQGAAGLGDTLWGWFVSGSGWTQEQPTATSFFTESKNEGRGSWWYYTTAGFASEYAKTNPNEDFAESFAAYFTAKAGWTFYAGGSGASAAPLKMYYLGLWFDSSITS